MEIGHIIPHIEALLFASDKPLTPIDVTDLINNAFGFMEDKITMEQVQTAIEGVVEKYNSEFYPFELRESGGGWQFLTKKDYHKTVAQLNGDKYLKRLSAAALETLAIIAYKQPITKADIEAIRGVSCDYSIQKLLEKELIVISGRNEDLPGKPLIYVTSRNFMDYFGINSPADLPKLKEVFSETAVDPTVPGVGAEQQEAPGVPEGDEVPLMVTENGELQESGRGEETDDTSMEQAASGEAYGNSEEADAQEQEFFGAGEEESPAEDAEAGEELSSEEEGPADSEPAAGNSESEEEESLSEEEDERESGDEDSLSEEGDDRESGDDDGAEEDSGESEEDNNN